MIRLLLIPLLLLVATTSLLFGQTYTMVNGGAINACSGALYDDGGPAGLQLHRHICQRSRAAQAHAHALSLQKGRVHVNPRRCISHSK